MKTLVRLTSPGGRAAAHQTLIFHRVLTAPDPLFPDEMTAARFESLLGCLKQHFHILPLSEAIERLQREQLPPASLSITFDDGYADNFEVAAPLLQRLDIPATVFVAPGFLDGGRMWNDTVIETARALAAGTHDLSMFGLHPTEVSDTASRRTLIAQLIPSLKHRAPEERLELATAFSEQAGRLPANLMMTSEQVRMLPAMGIEIGAHTMTHPILCSQTDTNAEAEIADSRTRLEEMTGDPVPLFAYPNGKYRKDFDDRHVAMVKRIGFTAAVSTNWGVSRRDSNLLQLPRFTPWQTGCHRFIVDLMRNRYGLIREP